MSSVAELRATLDDIFKNRKMSENTDRLLEMESFDIRLYAIYLIETYHYTSHNTKNQALVACRSENLSTHYQKFCLHHAYEECGHEYMALHDLNTLGHKFGENDLSEPLPETQALISYLYRTASHGNPYARLGYSFWAESSYQYIGTTMKMLQGVFDLKDSQMTFYKAHSEIDKDHIKEVEDVLTRFVKTQEDWQAVEDCMKMSLKLTGMMLDQVMGSYFELIDGKSNRYDYLKVLL